MELPLLVIDVQRGGPSTGLPTKTEQADLLQAMFGRNGEAPLPIVAPARPGDCFDAALEAVRIAVTYRTPVMLLSDGSLANGSEPWKVPDVSTLARRSTRGSRPTPNAPDGSGRVLALPARRRHARPSVGHRPAHRGWSTASAAWRRPTAAATSPTTPTTTTAWSGCAAAKIDGIVGARRRGGRPTGDASLLVLGWGSTYGPIGAGCRRVRALGHSVAQAHLRHLNPMPANLGELLARYETVLVPEMNLGQLSLLLRARYLVDVKSYTNVTGLPFKAEELQDLFLSYLSGVHA